MLPKQYVATVSIVDLKAITEDYCIACDSLDLTVEPMHVYVPVILSFMFGGSRTEVASYVREYLWDSGCFNKTNFAIDVFLDLTCQYLLGIEEELSHLGLNNDGPTSYFVAKCTREYSVYICTDAYGDRP